MKHIIPLLFILAILACDMKAASEVSVRKVSSPEELDLNGVSLGTFPGLGICGVFGNKIVPLDAYAGNPSANIEISDSIDIDAFDVAGRNVILKSENSLVWYSPERGFNGITLPDFDFTIKSASDSTVYIIPSKEQVVIEMRLRDKAVTKTITITDRPLAIQKLSDGEIIVTSDGVWVGHNGKWEAMYIHPTAIKQAAVTPKGIFFASREGLWRVESHDTVTFIVEGEVSDLFFESKTLYILDASGTLWGMTWP